MKETENVSMATVQKERDAQLEVAKSALLDLVREKENTYRNKVRAFQSACYVKRSKEWETLVLFQVKLAIHGRMLAPTRITFPEDAPTK